ncbi:MAG: hypothetical protein ACYSW0_16050 [Planctomycetota bacterium]|jgi:predicted RNase H-like nuclease (RuvC/YqgF family)
MTGKGQKMSKPDEQRVEWVTTSDIIARLTIDLYYQLDRLMATKKKLEENEVNLEELKKHVRGIAMELDCATTTHPGNLTSYIRELRSELKETKTQLENLNGHVDVIAKEFGLTPPGHPGDIVDLVRELKGRVEAVAKELGCAPSTHPDNLVACIRELKDGL